MSDEPGSTLRRAAPGSRIVEVKRTLDGRVQRFDCDLLAISHTQAVIRFRIARPSSFNTPLTVPAGSTSIGVFWASRPVSVYRFLDADGKPFAGRFDAVDEVSIKAGEVSFLDLILDWWVIEDDVLLEEDREDFDAAREAGQLTPRQLQRADEAARRVYSRYRHVLDDVDRLCRRFNR